jgi:Lar family restriction alleviation protein
MPENEIKPCQPCPFCGSEAVYFGEWELKDGKVVNLQATIMCLDCRSRGPIVTTRDEAIAAWNKRQEKAKK